MTSLYRDAALSHPSRLGYLLIALAACVAVVAGVGAVTLGAEPLRAMAVGIGYGATITLFAFGAEPLARRLPAAPAVQGAFWAVWAGAMLLSYRLVAVLQQPDKAVFDNTLLMQLAVVVALAFAVVFLRVRRQRH